MANPVVSLAADGGDIRLGAAKDEKRNDSVAMGAAIPGMGIRPQHRLLHDPAVTFEEYHYYALKTRAEEDALAVNDRGRYQSLMAIHLLTLLAQCRHNHHAKHHLPAKVKSPNGA